jgi:hypothetical protein
MGSRSGEALLAHELTHVAQQQRGLMRRGTFEDFHHAHEVEAHEVEHEVEAGGHSEGQGASAAAANQQKAAMASEEAKKEAIEKIKARVLEMMGESARNEYMRNGVSRRP